MNRSGMYLHAFASAALSLIMLAAIVGGCTPAVPEILSINPVQGSELVAITPAVIEIVFDQPMATAGVERAIFITPIIDGPPPVIAWARNNSILTLTFTQGFQPETEYEVVITQDAVGANGVRIAKPYSLTFTTASREVR